MAEYRVRLSLAGPIATPLHSGTLFGHLCWARRYREGEPALLRWLDELPRTPLLVSDAFPRDHLPCPLLLPSARPEQAPGETRAAFRQRLERDKRLRKTAWLRMADFLELRGGLSEARLLERLAEGQEKDGGSPSKGGVRQLRTAHNTIDRLTGTTPETGGLYFTDETWHDGTAREWDVYLAGAIAADELEELFRQVGRFGFGRDASLGRGRFTARVEPADRRLFAHSGDRLLSLSHGTLTVNMAEPLYRLHTHYGKLGGLYAGGTHSPFKHPLILARPGATFTPRGEGPFGELLARVHPHDAAIRHNAWHLCLPFTAV